MRKYLLLAGIFIVISCKHYNRNKAHKEIRTESVEKGEALAKQYCQSCHQFPEPSLLDVKSWEEGVLPNMGPRLGIFDFNFQHYPNMRRDRNLPAGFYPSQPVLSFQEWQYILDYYLATSPDSLLPQKRSYPIKNDLSLFRISAPASLRPHPTTCFIQVDTTQRPFTLWHADIFSKSVIRYDQQLQPLDSFTSEGGPIIDIDLNSRPLVATNVGLLNPSNAVRGKLETVQTDAGGKWYLDTAICIDSLHRPVQSLRVDLNGDGRPDELICEFGNLTGALSWYENRGDHYDRRVIRGLPGSIKAYVRDYNRDGRPDIFALFAQGEEGIFLFTNEGQGKFSEKEILRFPPSYGSSYFEMDDFNGDGFPDIVYTCGDNADFSQVLKPYHGVYIFLNDGEWNFSQKYFFPINGCYKAMAADFDGDGDLDLATISFFADYQRQPEEGFVYLENRGNFDFVPHSDRATQQGRWLTMDVRDFNGDGKPDIFLGNFSMSLGSINSDVNWRGAAPFLYLENISGKK